MSNKDGIKTNWIIDDSFEPYRILYTAKSIANGFYKLNKFNIVPYEEYGQILRNTPTQVIFPRLNISKFPKFWERVISAKVDQSKMESSDKALINFIKREINNYELQKIDYDNQIQKWEEIGKELFDAIINVVNLKKSDIIKLNIYVTRFGPGGSFNLYKDTSYELDLFMREGSKISNIVSCLVSGITRSSLAKSMNSTWQESTVVVDWILKESLVGEILNKYGVNKKIGTVESLRSNQNTKYNQISEKFYGDLGLPSEQFKLQIEDNIILYGQKKLKGLSMREELLLRKLISKEGSVVSYDDVSELIYNNPEKDFSLYSISKSIQRLRDKLDSNGIYSGYIETVRGKGFKLADV